jgi:hypothetical protein
MTLLPSRKVGIAFAGVFLIGGLVGALLVGAFHDMSLSRLFVSTADPKSMAARIDQKYVQQYQLTADEQARIAPLIREMTQRLYFTRRQFGVDIIATLDEYHGKIAEQMTPEHRAAFQKANEERRKRMSSLLLLDQPAPGAGQK